MRVAIDATMPMVPSSGSFRYLAELVRGIDGLDRDVDAHVIVTRETSDHLEDHWGTLRRVDLHHIDSATTIGHRLALAARAAERLEVDVLHSPAYFSPIRSRVPRVVTLHDLNFIFRFGDWAKTGHSLRAGRLSWSLARTALSTSSVIVPSRVTLQQVRLLTPWLVPRTSVIPWAYPAPITTNPSGFDDRQPIVLSVGALAPQKNLEVALRAFSRALPDLPPDSRYVLVGHDETSYWSRVLLPLAAQLGLEGRVSYEGEVPEARLQHLYETARVLVFVSRGEGYGFPAAEAMTHGLPIIASTSLSEVTRGAAYLVDHRDVQSIANEIRGLLRDDEIWSAHSRCGLVESQKRTWIDVAAEHVDAYERAADHAT